MRISDWSSDVCSSDLVVSLAEPEESGEDHGYLIVELDEAVSRGALKTLLSDSVFEVCDIQACVDSPDRTLHLVEVDGFLAAYYKRIAVLLAEAYAVKQACHAGSFAVPLTAEDLSSGSRWASCSTSCA